ncbi:hypothetical protein TEA_009837 [Camellia sinensis var. sinensis]|uniref:Uncharacterized protein n=1 Tax=Camellia sinensis var. sinensis TaxID=542762 RepID=A0A4S4D8T5_CAMSN|nr:hypothetical protein TEA_009837 [Camellia sinensis var. sinensis]
MASASDFICQHLFDDFATDDYFTANLNLSSTTTPTLSETQSSNSDDSSSISELRITSNCESVASASDLNLQIGNIEFDNFEFDTKPQITTPKHQSRLSDRRQMSIPPVKTIQGPNFSAGAQPQTAAQALPGRKAAAVGKIRGGDSRSEPEGSEDLARDFRHRLGGCQGVRSSGVQAAGK